MAYLTIRIKERDGHQQSDLALDRSVVGRAEDCDVSIKHDSISRQHCAFVRVGDSWYVEDLGSSNGTRINQDKIASRVELKERDIVKIGKARLTFHVGDRKKRTKKQAAAPPSDGLQLPEEALAGAQGGNALVHSVGVDDPPEAICCEQCAAWVSIAHHLAGDTMNCPSCNRAMTVPQLVS